jgi:hypothetical protein
MYIQKKYSLFMQSFQGNIVNFVKKTFTEFERDLVEKLDNLHENNPKEYWQLLNYVTKDRVILQNLKFQLKNG